MDAFAEGGGGAATEIETIMSPRRITNPSKRFSWGLEDWKVLGLLVGLRGHGPRHSRIELGSCVCRKRGVARAGFDRRISLPGDGSLAVGLLYYGGRGTFYLH